MQIMNMIATIIIMTGAIGVFSRQINKKVMGVFLSVTGLLLLANAQSGAYGFYGGAEAILMQSPVLLLFLLFMITLCKKNRYKTVDDLEGFRQTHPYLFVLFMIMGLAIIGIPGSGTFAAYMLEIMAMVSDSVTFFTYVGMAGIGLGVGILTIIFFDLWIHMLRQKELESVGISKALTGVITIVLGAVVVFGVWQVPVLQLISRLYEILK